MKDFIAALCAVALLFGGWLIFAQDSHKQIDNFTEIIRQEILPAVEDENWHSAFREMTLLSDNWHQYKNTAVFFLDTRAINDIDYSMAKSVKYIKAKDVSNASGELSAMIEQLTFLYSNDEVIWENVF